MLGVGRGEGYVIGMCPPFVGFLGDFQIFAPNYESQRETKVSSSG